LDVKPIKIHKVFWSWFVVLSFIARPIHEFGHWVVYKFYNIDVYFTLNQVVPKDISNFKLLGEAGGPLINMFLILVGFWIIGRTRLKELGAALIVTNSLSRLVPYLIIALTNSWKNNDEGIVALVLNLNPYTFYIIFGCVFILSIIICFRSNFQEIKKPIIRQLFFMFIIFTFIILILEIPQNIFFENYHFDLNEVIRYMQEKN
jgi:glucan phosphoethanolaminetransferase (alkaline phosphatase superfamily)